MCLVDVWEELEGRQVRASEVVSLTNQLKLLSLDGKKRLNDTLDFEGVIALCKVFPSNKVNRFVEWFTFSDESIDGKSKQKAYALFDSSFIDSIEVGTTRGLKQIHAYLFGGLYDFTGQVRQKNISKGGFQFAVAHFLGPTLKRIDDMPESSFEDIIDKYTEMNIAHPFMEGNGRSMRIWLDMMLRKSLGVCVDWSKIKKKDYLESVISSPVDNRRIKKLIKDALSDDINNATIYMKGIDYSYYYEE